MKPIQFLNPRGLNGLAVTVRDGDKWLSVKAGTPLKCYNADEATTKALADAVKTGMPPEAQVEALAVVLGTESFENLAAIPDFLMTLNHDPHARSVPGLIHALDLAYGKGEWGNDGGMTVVVLTLSD